MTLEQALASIESLPRTYPREVLTMDEWCPINTIHDSRNLGGEHDYSAHGGRNILHNVRGQDIWIGIRDSFTDLRGALNAIRKYIGREDVEVPALANPTFSLLLSGPNGGVYLVLKPSRGNPWRYISKPCAQHRDLARILLLFSKGEDRVRRFN